MQKKLITVSVRNRQGLLYSGQVVTVSSWNKKGPFDVLVDHANFISTIYKKMVMKYEDGKVEEIKVDSGLLQVYQNQVVVFLGIV